MRGPLSFDDVEHLEASARTPQAHRHAARTLLGWAEEQHPDDDEVTPAAFISAAAWHLDQAGDIDEGLELHRRATTAPGSTEPDARSLLHGALLAAGRLDEARDVAESVRRSRPDALLCTYMAENFEEVEDLAQAHRWIAMAVNRFDLHDEDPADDWDVAYTLRARRRIRQQLGFPPDEVDDLLPE